MIHVLSGVTLIIVLVLGSGWLGRESARRKNGSWGGGLEEVIAAKNGVMEQWSAERVRNDELNRQIDRQQALIVDLTRQIAHPPDPTAMIEAMGKAIATAFGSGGVGGPVMGADQIVTTTIPASEPRTDEEEPAQYFPDVEMDEWLANMPGYPTKGGWVNPMTNSQGRLPEGQTPVHAQTESGSLVRMDGQPMFRAGEGAAPPVGGME